MEVKNINIALIGNPNVGKTSVFNLLTGLNQQVGNYPGITVEKKIGVCKINPQLKATIIDLPGTYSLNASSLDENVVTDLLLNKSDKHYPQLAIVVTDVENLKRNLLLFTQIKDLEIPTLLVINMADRMEYKGISLNIPYLEQQLHTKIALISSRKQTGIDQLKQLITHYQQLPTTPCLNASEIDPIYFEGLKKAYPKEQLYKLWLLITQDITFNNLERKEIMNSSFAKPKDYLLKLQHKETIKRYQFINHTLKEGLTINLNQAKDLRSKIDRIALHKVYGYLLFFVLLLLIFQSIFDWANLPMDFIDACFSALATWVTAIMPAGMLTNLITQGIIPGIGGIVIFIPQIAFLFLFISILEESGYMSRVVFIMDKIMRKFGLSGKSVVPLISGTACAIPAIMATRNIENWKERLITILVTPFITCSARLPVYAIIIAIIIPKQRVLYILNLQAIALMGMYLIGFITAIIAAWILNKSLKVNTNTYFVVEMPNYKLPLIKNVALTVLEKTKSFVLGAGKIILALSIILWFLASYGPATQQEKTHNTAASKLESSYIGHLGKTIEPAIKPLGYDWKIGVALLSSFAAREIFVSTLATIYSIENQENQENTVKQKLEQEINPNTGQKLFNSATGTSLLLFYAFAMQCISTLAITKKETNSWKWPLAQLALMTTLAYTLAFIAYQLLK